MGHANSVSPTSKNENPGALAGATGADFVFADSFGGYATRHALATELIRAIVACPPKEAALIMAAALAMIGAGTPPPTLRKVMIEARQWAGEATVYELRGYAAACVEAMEPAVRGDFIAYVVETFADPSPELEAAE